MPNSNKSRKRIKPEGRKLLEELRQSTTDLMQPSLFPSRVFLLHGQDITAKESVVRFIESLGLEVVIPYQQSSRGKTIIELFEDYSDVDFAVVLLTPDKTSTSLKKEKTVRLRPSPSLFFEFGYFVGRLGRNRVCVLRKGEAEILPDFQGMNYIVMDSNGRWKFRLALGIKNAGIDVDLNKL